MKVEMKTHQNEVVSEAMILGEMEKPTLGVDAVEEGSGRGRFNGCFCAHGGSSKEAGIRVFESALGCGNNGTRRRAKEIDGGGKRAASGRCKGN